MAATMVDQEYKGLQNLDKFVSNRLNLRANNLASRLGIEESIKADVTEQKGVMAEETADQTVEVAEREEAQEKRKAKPFIKALNLEAKVNNTTLGEMLNSALAKNVALGIKQYDAEISANRTVTPFIQYIKNELAEDLHKDIAKTIDQYPGGGDISNHGAHGLSASQSMLPPISQNQSIEQSMPKSLYDHRNPDTPPAIRKGKGSLPLK